MEQHLLLYVFIYLAAAIIMIPIASRFKLGSVLGYLFIGIFIGPYGLQLISNPEQIMHFAEFGVIMMIFLIGLELEPSKLWQLRHFIIGLGGFQVILTTGILTGLGIFMGYDWRSSLAISMTLSLSSTALVLQILQEKNMLKTNEGNTTFAVLLFQDLAVIPILIILPLLNTQSIALTTQESSFILALPRWLHSVLITGVIGTVILTGHYLSRHLFLMVARTELPEVFTACSLALIVGITLLMQYIGVSPALGAFIGGVVLANSQYKHTVEADIKPFKGLLLGLFFISVGMSINFTLLSQQTTLIIATVLGLISIKASVLAVLGRFFKFTKRQIIGLALILCQGGEFSFVLFKYATETQVISKEVSGFFTLVVALSMLITPFLMLFYHNVILPRLSQSKPEQNYDSINEQNDIILAGYGRFGQIIGRFLNGEHIKVTVLEKNQEQIELIRKFGYKGYFGDANRLELLESAGAKHAKLLIITVSHAQTSLEIVRLAKTNYPHLKIFARAHDRRHAYELHQLGVDYFRRELFDSSLTMTKEVLKFLGYKSKDIESKSAAFQAHDEESLKKSFEFFEEEKQVIHFARKAKGELERILQNS